ncbi:MAG: 3',5'-cyclic-nucleotide phosphodiesterase [Pyrinomonadaceae bacterium]
MKIQFLPSSFDKLGCASQQQHLPCFLIDDCVAIDAGSLALAVTDVQRQNVRDIIITHPHLDHIATLPIFIDDLFAELRQPVCVYATPETIEALEQHIFNWKIFPRFNELTNDFGTVLEYKPIELHEKFMVKDLEIIAVPVNHQIPTVGLIVSSAQKTIAFTSDTAATENFWEFVNDLPNLNALLIECAFPNSRAELANVSNHLTPQILRRELAKFKHNCPVLVINLKPMYRSEIVNELLELSLSQLEVLQVGKVYEF